MSAIDDLIRWMNQNIPLEYFQTHSASVSSAMEDAVRTCEGYMKPYSATVSSAIEDAVRSYERHTKPHSALISSAIEDVIRSVRPYLQDYESALGITAVVEQLRRESLVFDAMTLPENAISRHLRAAHQQVALEITRAAAFADLLQTTEEGARDATVIRPVVKTLIIPGDRTKEGILVKGVTALWFEILRMILNDPDSIHQIDCWKWEELLAGAYKQGGWETVVLTPKRGDHGIDVIAERKGLGQLRFKLLDQMKAYKPGHLIGPDEIREMKGVMGDHPEASKGLITTTADFTPGALAEAENLYPRLELRPGNKLVPWLAEVAVEYLRASDTIETEGPTNA